MLVVDLFSGIGGLSLGLERAGMQTVAFCEIDARCRDVLRRHWPDVPVHGDVRALRGLSLSGLVGCGETHGPDRHAKQWAKASRGRSVTATLPTEPEKRASGHGTGSGDTLASPLAVVLAGAAVAAAITSSSADASPAPASDSFVSGGGDFGGGGSSGSFE